MLRKCYNREFNITKKEAIFKFRYKMVSSKLVQLAEIYGNYTYFCLEIARNTEKCSETLL